MIVWTKNMIEAQCCVALFFFLHSGCYRAWRRLHRLREPQLLCFGENWQECKELPVALRHHAAHTRQAVCVHVWAGAGAEGVAGGLQKSHLSAHERRRLRKWETVVEIEWSPCINKHTANTSTLLCLCCVADEANLRRAKWLAQLCQQSQGTLKEMKTKISQGCNRLKVWLLNEAHGPDVFQQQGCLTLIW